MKYKKKPIIVEAIEVRKDNIEEVLKFIEHNYCTILDDGIPIYVISTLEGDMEATIGDYIIKGIHNEVYPCKVDIFLETYDLVEE